MKSNRDAKSSHAIFDFVAILLILIPPFVEFAYTNNFIFEVANAIVLAGYTVIAFAISLLINKYPNRLFRALILTALIVVFLDARVDIFRLIGIEALLVVPVLIIVIWLLYWQSTPILIAVFGGIFVGIFLRPVLPDIQEFSPTQVANSSQTNNLPIYVHIVLDEHAGIEAFVDDIESQKDFKQSAKTLFIGNGFRLFGRAYSEYIDTYDSMPSALNSYSGINPGKYYERDRANNSHTLTENKYFQDLHASGYNISVYQTLFVDYCAQSKDIVQRCLTYNAFGTTSTALAQFDTGEKLDVILAMFKFFYSRGIVRYLYTRLAGLLAQHGIALPIWEVTPNDLGPIPVLPVLDEMISDIANAKGGDMFFAHLLLPHHPYSVDRNCDVRRPVLKWKAFEIYGLGAGRVNTTHSRAELYEDYVEQSRCALKKIDELIEAMKTTGSFESSTIIIHGDHGSRIGQFLPRISTRDKLSRRDYFDGYSTLYAIKAPHVTPGYDLRMLSFRQLLRLAEIGAPDTPATPDEHFVFLREQEFGSNVIKVPMAEIPGGPPAPPNVRD